MMRGSKVIPISELIRQNREKREAKTQVMGQNKIEVKFISGLYAISIPFQEYEILVEVPPPNTDIPTDREDSISIFYNGIDVTHSFVDTKTGKRIHPSGSNLARVMALIMKKDQEEGL